MVLARLSRRHILVKSMRSKILSKQTLLLIAFSGLIFSVALFVYGTPQNLIRGSSAPLIASIAVLSHQEQVSIELPVRLKIPAIQVDSTVIPVGLTSDGAMDVPKGPAEVAWFNLGSRPGESGTAVIVGHYGWKNNTPAVFDNLHTVRAGDTISVQDDAGVDVTFVVREIRIYGKNEAAPDVFGSSDGKAHLNLITCTGVWNKAEGAFSERLVVFTDKE